MKICLDCEFAQMKTVETDRGPTRVLCCTHDECRDPISGVPLPLNTARTQDYFCGIKAKYWKLKEAEPAPKEGNVIQLPN